MLYNSIQPGQPIKDNNGDLIQAHGGSILFHKGTYYWYGENKENTHPGNGIWHYGVRCYSSKDLYNWKSEGIILAPSEDEKNPMHKKRIMDRPHIIYNERSKQFVMWVKFAGTEEEPSNWRIQYMGVAVSEDITKPFRMVHTIRPLGMEMGDFDLYVEKRDGKGYFIADRIHTEVVIADLTDDYLDVTGHYSSHFPNDCPPLSREAPAMFKRNGSYYILTSGTTGYEPNPTEAARAKLIHGPYTNYGNPCVNDRKQTSFDCQFCSVFKHPEREDLYIAVGDRWMAKTVYKDGEVIADTFEAGHILLPICFHADIPYIQWRDEWKIEDYKQIQEEHSDWDFLK